MIQVARMPSAPTPTEPFTKLRKQLYLYLIALALLGNIAGFSHSELSGFATPTRRLLNIFTILSLGFIATRALQNKLNLKQLERYLFAIGIALSLSTLAYLLYIEYPAASAQGSLFALFTWLPSVYILTFFVFKLRLAIVIAFAYLLVIFLITLPHGLNTLGGSGIYEGIPSFLQFFTANIFTITALYGFALFRSHALKQEGITQELRILVMTDVLTNLANRRHMTDLLEAEFVRAERYGHGFSIILIDIDRFKRINDRYGHDAGDEVLKSLAATLQDQLRVSDIASRWGGEEFLILLPETQNDAALHVAQTLRKRVALTLSYQNEPITISGGVASYQANDDLKSTLKRADDALYVAKQNGRNQIANQSQTKATESPEAPESGAA